MIISEKQQQANEQNAQEFTGPSTPEGKNAVRFNALTHGLRTRETILVSENAKDYSDLWDELGADWQPQTRTERCYLETMVTPSGRSSGLPTARAGSTKPSPSATNSSDC